MPISMDTEKQETLSLFIVTIIGIQDLSDFPHHVIGIHGAGGFHAPRKTQRPRLGFLVLVLLIHSYIAASGELGSEFAEEVGGAAGAGLRERRGLVGQAGRGGRAVVGGGAALAQLPVERAAAGRSSGETNTVRGGRTANAVGGSNGSSLIGNSAVLLAILYH